MFRVTGSSKQRVFRSPTPMTREQIAQWAPSVLGETAHESRSDRYTFIPTSNVLDGLEAEGFRVFEVRQTKTRDVARREFTKHMLRLRHGDSVQTRDGETGEIILINSHDGTSTYQLMAGWFRFVCSNGLVAGDVCDTIRVRHSGNIVDNVIEGSYRVLDSLELAAENIDRFKGITLDSGSSHEFATRALGLRWDSGKAPIKAEDMLGVRRWDDRAPSLWNVFNVVQENMIKGGIAGRAATGRRMQTREIRNVAENIRLNRELWNLANEFAGNTLEPVAA